jgi:phage gp36-like protein
MNISARPHLNGNTAMDFSDAGYNVIRAAEKLRSALAAARSDCLHDRNYADQKLRDADIARLDSYLMATFAAEEFGRELATIAFEAMV